MTDKYTYRLISHLNVPRFDFEASGSGGIRSKLSRDAGGFYILISGGERVFSIWFEYIACCRTMRDVYVE